MADYQLTQTGQEVQDILDSLGATYFFSQVCSTWVSDNTYPDYPYKGTISLVGIDGTMGVEVSYGNAEAVSGNYSPICNTVNDAVEIWSKVNDTITIPTIKIYKNGYVSLAGSSNYMPQSGGNFTGAISVNTSPVVTVASLQPTSDTFTMTGLSGTCKWSRSGNIVTITLVNCAPTTAMSSGNVLTFGTFGYKPIESVYGFMFDNATANVHAFCVTSLGELQVKALANIATSAVLRGSITYITND